MIKNQKGSVTIEAVVSFTAFLFLIFTILGVINYCKVQTEVSLAVDNTAKELSQYSYFYKMSGLDKLNDSLAVAGNTAAEKIDPVIGATDGFFQSFGAVKSGVQGLQTEIEGDQTKIDNIKNILNNIKTDAVGMQQASEALAAEMGNISESPVEYLKCLAALAGTEAFNLAKSHVIAAPIAKAFTAKHFGSNNEEINNNLKKLGIEQGLDGLNFKLSQIFAYPNTDEIHLVVYYDVKLFDFFGIDTKVTLCKESVVRAWLSGDAEINQGGPAEPEEEKESLWSLAGPQRGKEITREEKAKYKDRGYYTANKYFDAYNQSSNEFVQIKSIDVFSESYINNEAALKRQLSSYCQTFQKHIDALGDNLKMYDSSGEQKEVQSNKNTRTLTMVFIVPEGASINSSVLSQIKKAYPNMKIEVKTGYGTSPKQES